MAKKLLLLGGTAFFGKDIARCYAEAGWEVTLFTRGTAMPPDLPPHRHLRGDRRSAADMARAGKEAKWDVVVDNLAYTGEDVNLAVDAFPGVGRYLLCSTVSVYRYVKERYPQPLREEAVDFLFHPAEEDLTDVHWKYARGKMEAEKVLKERGRMPWTVLRPPVVYGPFDPTDRGFWYLARLLRGGPVLLADGGNASFRLSYSRDVAKAFFDAALSAKTVGRAYNVVQEEVITLRNFVEESARALGVKAELVSAPRELLGEMAGAYGAPIMTNFVPDNRAAREDFGFRHSAFESWVASTAQWFRKERAGEMEKLLETRGAELEWAKGWKKSLSLRGGL